MKKVLEVILDEKNISVNIDFENTTSIEVLMFGTVALSSVIDTVSKRTKIPYEQLLETAIKAMKKGIKPSRVSMMKNKKSNIQDLPF